MRRLLLLALASALLWAPSSSLAQSFAAGYAKYQKGDFYGAEQVLRAALPNTADAPTKAKVHKFLGISQFMNGDKKGAEASFREAVKLAPSLTISKSEVLDESVIPMFDAQKATATPPAAATTPIPDAKAAAPKAQATAAPSPPVAKPPTATAQKSPVAATKATMPAAPKAPVAAAVPAPLPQKGPASKGKPADAAQPNELPIDATPPPEPAGGSKQALKKTLLRVQSNAEGASVMMSGIIAGGANTAIEADAGDVEIEVVAAGYISRRIKVRIVKDQETVVTVDLEKPKKKKKAVGKKAAPPAADDFGFFGDEPSPAKGRRSRREAPANSGPDMISEFERDQAGAAPFPGGYPPPSEQRPNATIKPANALVAVLPFGGGQFQSHRYGLGAGLALGQLGALYFAYSENQKGAKAASERDSLINERNAEGKALSDDEDEFVETSTKYVKDRKQNAIYGGAAFGAMWILGVVDALLYERDQLLRQKAHPARAGYYGSLTPLQGGGIKLALSWIPSQ